MENGCPPFVKTTEDTVLFTWDCPKELFVDITMSGIDAAITDHLEMFLRYVTDQTLNKIQHRYRFCNVRIILMPVVMESDVGAIIVVNT